MKRATPLFPGGVTLVELMLASALVSIIMIFIFTIVRNVGQGVVFIQTVVPLRQDLQFAKQTMERDLFSSVRSSLGNVLPNPGFEAVPARISTFTPTPMNSWSCIPVPVQNIPGGRVRYSFGSVSNRPEFRFRGNFGLGLNSLNTYMAFSSTFPLVDGGQYLVGGWIRQTIEPLFGGPGDGFIRLLGDGASWPSTERVKPSFSDFANPNWTFIWSTVDAVGGFTYRVELGVNFEPRGLVSHFGFDDVVVAPFITELTPTSGQVFEFDRFETAGALAGQRIKIRYRMVPLKNSGQLIRERVPIGAPVSVLGEINNIRRCQLAWDFGGPAPGVIGPTTDLSRGLNFPLIVTLEAGPVGATGNQTESLSFSVFPEVP
jgi:hypothetical protein